MTISLSRGVGSLRFNKSSVGGQAAIEFILFAVMLIIAFAFLIMTYLDNGGFRGGRDSPDVELTQTGTIEGKYIDSAGFSKSYYVTVRNGSHQADHEVSLAEYNAAAETKKVELAERQADVRERELNATVKKQAEADRYAAEQAAEADLYKRTKQAEAARIERQNASDAELYSAQKDAEGIKAKATAEAEATRLKGEADGASEKSRGEGIAAGVKAQAQAYNGMENPYLLANRYIDIMPKVAEQVAKPLTAVDSIKMYGSGNAQKLVKETTSIVDQVASGLKDSTGIDLPSLLNGLISNPNTDANPAEGMTD